MDGASNVFGKWNMYEEFQKSTRTTKAHRGENASRKNRHKCRGTESNEFMNEWKIKWK